MCVAAPNPRALARLVPLALMVWAAASCTTLQEASSAATGCPSDLVRVYDERSGPTIRTWRAVCRNDVYECAVNHTDYVMNTRCRPTEGPRAAAVTRPRPSAASVLREIEADDSPVERSSAPKGKVLSTRISEGPFGFTLTARPADDPATVRLVVSLPPSAVGEGCELRMMLDGEIVEPFPRTQNAPPDRGRLFLDVPVSVLIRFVPFHRVVGRVCDAEFRLQPASQDRIRELLLRMDEELKWLGQPGLPLERDSPKQDETYRL